MQYKWKHLCPVGSMPCRFRNENGCRRDLSPVAISRLSSNANAHKLASAMNEEQSPFIVSSNHKTSNEKDNQDTLLIAVAPSSGS